MAWTHSQARSFAKQIAESREGKAWWAFPPTVRTTIISHHVLSIVFGQDKTTVVIEDVRALRIAVEERLASHHRMATHDD